MRGKLIIIEGVDGSGKATQSELLYNRLVADGNRVRKIEFPNYASQSSALVKMYLNGEFGTDPDSISPYVASSFYAVDRYASFKKDWGTFYNDGGVIIADRYTTSNMVHQAAKIDRAVDRDKFLDWLYDYEFNIFGIPVPDSVIFLDMPPEFSLGLLSNRAVKSGDVKQDIHEANQEYLIKAYNNAHAIAEKYQWHKVRCANNCGLKTIEVINDEVHALVLATLCPQK